MLYVDADGERQKHGAPLTATNINGTTCSPQVLESHPLSKLDVLVEEPHESIFPDC